MVGRRRHALLGVPACRRLRQRHRAAKLEIGWSEASAASSVSAFSLRESPQAFCAA
jgi:hypothetical protein